MVCAVKGYPSGWACPRLKLIDQTVPVDGADATLAGALQVAATAPEGTTLLCMLPDTGERYLSTPLLDGIGADMSDEELEISRSTPGARFDSPAPSPAPAAYAIPAKPESASAAIQVSVDVENFVAQVVRAGRHPLQMDRPRLDGLPGGRPRRADSRPAARAHRQHDYPESVRRRGTRRRLHQHHGCVQERSLRGFAGTSWRCVRPRCQHRPAQLAARVAASALKPFTRRWVSSPPT